MVCNLLSSLIVDFSLISGVEYEKKNNVIACILRESLTQEILIFLRDATMLAITIPSRVVPKTQKMILDAISLNTQHYKVRIKAKVEPSREWNSTLANFSCIYIYIYICI